MAPIGYRHVQTHHCPLIAYKFAINWTQPYAVPSNLGR